MEGMENATWHEGAHVRDMALSYALLLLRSRILTTDNYLQEAGKMWDFLREGVVPMPVIAAEDFPDDLSSFDPSLLTTTTVPTASPPSISPSTLADLAAHAEDSSLPVDEETKKAIAEMFGVDPSKISRINVSAIEVPDKAPSQPEADPGYYLDDRVANQEWDNLDGRAGGYATNPGVIQKHNPGIVDDSEDD